MSDKTIPQLDPVVTPAATDRFGVRQAGDTEDKRETRAQVHTLEVGEHLLLPTVDEPATPTLAFGDGDTGWYERSDDDLRLSIAGLAKLRHTTTDLLSIVVGSYSIRSTTTSSRTAPTLVPNNTSPSTGLGGAGSDELSLVAGGVEMLRVVELPAVADRQVIVHPSGIIGSAATPGLAFGDGDTGWFELSDDELTLSVGGTVQQTFDVDGKLFINTITGVGPIGSIVSATPADVIIFAAGSATAGVDGGNVDIWGGYANGTGVPKGGDVRIWGGGGGGSNPEGGDVNIFGGDAPGPGGDLVLRGGNTTASGVGGPVFITGGESSSSFAPGAVNITGGEATANFTQAGGDVNITGGLSGSQDTAVGGAVTIAGGTSGATNGVGGDLNLNAGAGTGSGADGQVIVGPALSGTAAAPLLAFGDGDTGFFEDVDDRLVLSVAGIEQWEWVSDQLRGANGTGPMLQNETVSATNPTISPDQNDDNTGIGSSAFDALSLIAGGFEGLRFTELNSGVVQAPSASVAVTAFAGGGQGSATALIHSYNIITTVATAGDSVRLPAVFAVNSLVYVKNDDAAESADVFPASGDDLGAGVNTAVALAAGESLTFIGTVVDSTWTQLIVGGGAGGAFTEDGSGNVFSEAFTGTGDHNFITVDGAGAAIVAGQSGSNNMLVGENAGSDITTGSGNVGIGLSAGRAITTGGNNVAIGFLALGDAGGALDSFQNVAIGTQAMLGASIGSASNNTAINDLSLSNITDGDFNIAIGGDSCLHRVTSGQSNIGIGGQFNGRGITTGDFNIALGGFALGRLNGAITADGNIAIGQSALVQAQTTATLNTAIGHDVGANITTGGSNVLLGTGAGPTGNVSNELFINNSESDTPLIHGDFAASLLTINGDFVGVGFDAAAPAASSITGGDATAATNVGGALNFTAGDGNTTGAGGAVALIGGISGATDAAVGGAVNLTGGTSAATNGDGGDVVLTPGVGTGSGADGQVIIAPTVTGSAAAPSLAFGDGNTGFFEDADNQLHFTANGSEELLFNVSGLQAIDAAGPGFLNEAATATNPTLIPNRADIDTGIGWSSGDSVSIVCGGVQGIRFSEVSGQVMQAPETEVGMTAFATGGQGSATQIDTSWAVFSTVATLADSAKLAPIHSVGTIVTVKNDGAADMDLFPASGDDLGAGVDTAVSVVAGTAAAFVSTVLNSTWTQLF